MEQDLLQLGGLIALFALAIREFFAYIRLKKNSVTGNETFSVEILKELQTMNGNHLHSIETAINTGNANLINSIHQDNMKIVELLSEIKGRLK